MLVVDGLTVALPPGADRMHAVERISFAVERGEIVCMVGESGSGKSVTAHAIMGLLPKGQLVATAGRALLEGTDLLELAPGELRRLRGDRMSMIFQEPMTALNPVMRVGDQIEEVLKIHSDLEDRARRRRVLEIMAAVHLPDAERMIDVYPHQLSGGQRQRIMIAAALVLDPVLLIADEPTTALDVTTQAQILKLIKELQQRRGTGVLFITHDFGVVAEVAHRVVVMQHGRVVEQGRTEDALRPHRKRVQIVFQDPYRSLNPRRSVGAAIVEGPINFGTAPDIAHERARQLMRLVGLDPDALERYPHQFSGGQRQRICIARALAMDPEILVADEPVSALDVSVQAQVLNLLEDLKTR